MTTLPRRLRDQLRKGRQVFRRSPSAPPMIIERRARHRLGSPLEGPAVPAGPSVMPGRRQ